RFPGKTRHILARLELLTFDHVEIAQNPFSLTAQQGIKFATHPLRHTRCIVHQARHLVEKAVAGLGHISPPAPDYFTMAIRPCRRKTRRASTSRRGVRSTEADLAMPVLVIPYPTFDPVLVQLRPFAIRCYALPSIFRILLASSSPPL